VFTIFDIMRTADGRAGAGRGWSGHDSLSGAVGVERRDKFCGNPGRVSRGSTEGWIRGCAGAGTRGVGIEFTERVGRANGQGGAPGLGLHLLMGEKTPIMIGNILAMMKEGVLEPVGTAGSRVGVRMFAVFMGSGRPPFCPGECVCCRGFAPNFLSVSGAHDIGDDFSYSRRWFAWRVLACQGVSCGAFFDFLLTITQRARVGENAIRGLTENIGCRDSNFGGTGTVGTESGPRRQSPPSSPAKKARAGAACCATTREWSVC